MSPELAEALVRAWLEFAPGIYRRSELDGVLHIAGCKCMECSGWLERLRKRAAE